MFEMRNIWILFLILKRVPKFCTQMCAHKLMTSQKATHAFLLYKLEAFEPVFFMREEEVSYFVLRCMLSSCSKKRYVLKNKSFKYCWAFKIGIWNSLELSIDDLYLGKIMNEQTGQFLCVVYVLRPHLLTTSGI